MFVNGQIFIAPDPVDVTGSVMTAGPAMVGIAKLALTVGYLFSDSVQAARIRAIFENTSNIPIDITVEVTVNFGSDATTMIKATVSGDRSFNINDRWLVTADGVPDDPLFPVLLAGLIFQFLCERGQRQHN